MRQLESQYRTTLETIGLEVEVAVREQDTSQKELSTKYAAMQARALQLDSLAKRWERLPGEGLTAALTLENMLVAQERLVHAEFEYLQAQVTYNLALVNHKRATGLLLQSEEIGMNASGGHAILPPQRFDTEPYHDLEHINPGPGSPITRLPAPDANSQP